MYTFLPTLRDKDINPVWNKEKKLTQGVEDICKNKRKDGN